jgi:hypothetical protein
MHTVQLLRGDTSRGSTVAATLLHAGTVLLLSAGAVFAQAPPAGPGPDEIETAPIRCWWRTDTTHVRIGERFTVTLTCAVIDTSSITVVASTNSLDPGAVQLTPFDVVGGRRHDDLMAPPWRYFQYDYRVRLLSEGFFGQDVQIPSLPVTYTIQSAAGGGGQGRDLTYQLPALSLRVASLVPRDASDIRDDAVVAFEGIQARRFRATSATMLGGVLLAFGGVILLAGVVRTAARARSRRSSAVRVLAPSAALHAAVRGLAGVKADVAGGWTPALARRAAAMVRVAASVATGRPLAQALVTGEASEREGQVALRQGLVRRRRYLVSAAATPATIARELEARRVPTASRPALEALARALQTFTAAGYGRNEEIESTALAAALSESVDAIRQLRRRSRMPAAPWSAWRASAAPLGPSSMGPERL